MQQKEQEQIKKILADVDVPVEDPRFYPRVFRSLSQMRSEADAEVADQFQRIVAEEYEELSGRLDESLVQESCSVRNMLRTRTLVDVLIDDKGKLDLSMVSRVAENLKHYQYSLGPNRQYDAKRNEHLIKTLTLLKTDKQLARKLHLISKPHMHRYADQIIRETLQLSEKTVITDAYARRAALAALLCYLRQNVGSCFATAPAIIIHREQPEVFLKDIQELLGAGRLVRTVEGIEYAAPLSYSWGAGDLRRIFVFEKGPALEEQKIWLSPGIIKALESVEMIPPDLSLKKKQQECKKLILEILNNWETAQTVFIATIEDILRRLFLRHFALTEEDLEEDAMRPKGMIHGGLLMQLPVSAKGSGKHRRCSEFLQKFAEAKNIFKSYADNALLKAWEFTLASFSETKARFTQWNLYSSLGFGPNEKGGIGPCLYEILKRKLDECNEKVQEYQFDYEQLYTQLQYLQRRIRSASSEQEAKWMGIDYQAKANEFRSIEELRDTFHQKARRYANLFDGLVDLYYRLFPSYFQEIYDADIHEVTTGPYDDSPAGFRLLYKHGRTNTSQWTLINHHLEFIEALVGFFTATEMELARSPEMSGLEDDLGEIVTAIVSRVRSQEFIETAFHRMAFAHKAPVIKDPLEHLDKIEKKPWVYTSGGSMSTLVSCYFRLGDNPKEVSRWVENPMELLVFLSDVVKEIPDSIREEFENDSEKSLLIHSPTHAFLLKPGYPSFKRAWKSSEFTYTWVRDRLVRPMERFSQQLYVDADRMQFVIDNLYGQVPKNYQHYFRQSFQRLGGAMNVQDFRQHIVDTIALTPGLQFVGRGVLSSAQIDATLYSLLPLFPSYQLKEKVETLLSRIPQLSERTKENLLTLLEDISGRIGTEKTVSAKGLQNILKAMIALVTSSTSTEVDYPLLISQIAQQEGLAMPAPIIFADTNWVKDHFAFIVNPGSGKLELWRVDYTGSVGAPMVEWEHWLNGSRKEPDWGVYHHPHEYRY
ncbi:MAG: hypothetical protein WB791_03810 [Waddliaceae bacterium]